MLEEIGDYKIYEQVGGDGFGNVFAVFNKCEKDKKVYILKTLVGKMITDINIKTLQNEIEILNELNQDINSQYIPKLYAADKFNYPKDGNSKKARPYFVIDYFSRDNLYEYLTAKKFANLKIANKYEEKHAKVLFKKILLGVQYCHKKNIYHLDLKPANIVFDKDFEPTIIDFGLSEKSKISKDFEYGADNYKCPEKWEETEFLSEKADIFSLGAILFNLVTGKPGFSTSKKDDYFYKHIYKKDTKDAKSYWDSFKHIIKFNLTKEFKELYIQMVSFDPSERPTLDQIFESEWMKEINNLKKEEEEKLEKEVKSIMNKLYEEIKGENILIQIANNLELNGFNVRDDNDENDLFKNVNIKPTKIPNDKIIFNNYIILNGYLNPIKFMNSIINQIKINFKDDELRFEVSEENLKFNLIFYNINDEEEKEEEKEEEENIKSVMQIELFEYEDGRHLLEFFRTKGEFPDYYKHFLKIKEIIREMFSKK